MLTLIKKVNNLSVPKVSSQSDVEDKREDVRQLIEGNDVNSVCATEYFYYH